LYISSPHHFGYLAVVGGGDVASWDWIRDSLEHSDVLKFVDHRSAEAIRDLLAIAAWVLLVALLVNADPEDFKDEIRNGSVPAFLDPLGAVGLIKILRDQPSVEKILCENVWSEQVGVVRAQCKAMRPSLLNAMRARHLALTSAPWLLGETSEWGKWCGG
jgi:hypothetical protein